MLMTQSTEESSTGDGEQAKSLFYSSEQQQCEQRCRKRGKSEHILFCWSFK